MFTETRSTKLSVSETPTFSEIPFTKMHGLGNDFVVLDERKLGRVPANENWLLPLASRICDRRFGVGADQILWLRKPTQPDCQIRMETVNADGSLVEMCGNGIRAVAVYLNRDLAQNGIKSKSGQSAEPTTTFLIETGAGVKEVQLRKGPLGNDLVQVDMGPPQFGTTSKGGASPQELLLDEPGAELLRMTFREVSMGNPHAVIFADDVSKVPVNVWGPRIETHPRFPRRTNVEWVQVTGPNSISVRVWERGTGITLACGTGACAAAVATWIAQDEALDAGLTSGGLDSRAKGARCLDVHLPGGMLKISWAGGTSSVLMEGPAEVVFDGKLKGAFLN